MKVHIAQVVKEDYFDNKVNAMVTMLGIAVHPVLSISENDGTADVSHEGVRPTVIFNSQVMDHTDVTRALRDLANMIDSQMDNKTEQELHDELRRQDIAAGTSGREPSIEGKNGATGNS